MKKGNVTILASIFVMVLVAAGVGAGTMAYFSDVEMSTDNTFTAGTIDLSAPVVLDFWLEDLKPCDEGFIEIEIHNDGTNEMDVWKHLTVTDCSGGISVYPDPITGPASSEPEYEECLVGEVYVEECDIDTVITYDLWLEVYDDSNVKQYEGFIINPSIDELKISEIDCFYIYLGSLPPGWTFIVIQSYHMQPEVTNWAQGDDMTFDIEFFAEQLGGPGPTPELLGYGRD